MSDYHVAARRVDSHGSLAVANEAEVVLDTDLAGRRDAMNPVELLLAAVSPTELMAGKILGHQAILASNTSSIPITRIAAATKRAVPAEGWVGGPRGL